MGYEFRTSASPLIHVVWRAEVEEPGEFTDAANEFWGIAFDRDPEGALTAVLIGPSLEPRTVTTRAGEVSWGVEFGAAVFLRGVAKATLLGAMQPLAVHEDRFEVGGSTFAVPAYDELEVLVAALLADGLLSFDPMVAGVLAGDDAQYSERQLRRRASRTTGLGPKQLTQLRRARHAYGLMSAGRPLAEVAAAAGYSDQAHLTRSLRVLAGMTPARILAEESDVFASRPTDR